MSLLQDKHGWEESEAEQNRRDVEIFVGMSMKVRGTWLVF